MSARENWAFHRRNWRRHPVLAGLQAVCLLGLGIVGVVDLVSGLPDRVRGACHVGFQLGCLLPLVVFVRRDEPTSGR